MKMIIAKTFTCLLAVIICGYSIQLHAQDNIVQDIPDPVIPGTYISSLTATSGKLEKGLDKTTKKLLRKLRQQELRMYSKLSKIDSSKANALRLQSEKLYEQQESRLSNTGNNNIYIPALDTVVGSLNFLKQNPGLLKGTPDTEALTKAVEQVNELRNQFTKADQVNKFIREKKQFLNQQLQGYGLTKDLLAFNKQVQQYRQTVEEYKNILKDHKKIEKKALQLLSRSKPFKEFMRKNGQMASLFGIHQNANNDPAAVEAALASLQTRSQIDELIQQRLVTGGPNAQGQLNQNFQDAQGQLNILKNKMLQQSALSKYTGEVDMPDGFTPPAQKTKTFFQRLEWGANMQSQRSDGVLPVRSDIGISIGYKINEKSVIGLGAGYAIGWGESIRKIKISHQGVGIRSFIDWKLKRSFWMTGGYEWNHKPALGSIEGIGLNGELLNLSEWQQSGLLGISKQIALQNKYLKKTKLQLLWDILSYRQEPRSPAFLFRVGYGF